MMDAALDLAPWHEITSVDAREAERLPPPGTADALLVERAQSGDLTAFEELVRRYRNDVFSLSYHYVRSREEAWDISQEVFFKAYRALGQFRGDSGFKTWLLRITANHCKDQFKKRRLDTIRFDETLHEDDMPAASSGPDESAEAKELGAAISTALESLSAKHRTAFILREFEGMSYEEMAQVMGCSLGTVMSRLHHARRKLQQSLVRMGVVEDMKNG
ncbi:MAG: sigma-70 family RNA polymerase sigma factor [Candidatus Hydrogenedentes bacterium]|nr:sigma-70 family RNA polymerase sigma factor [Candidatus Hydrogenedentota bacterium]